MRVSEISALLNLLEDEDDLIWQSAESALEKLDLETLQNLVFDYDLSEIQLNRVNKIALTVKYSKLKNRLEDWKANRSHHLLEAMAIVCNVKYNEVSEESLSNSIEKLRLEAWLEFHYDLTAFEKIKIINYILFQLNGFKGDESDFLNPDNSFLNKVLENRKGNPISLAIVYLIISQNLNLPVFGVNLPKHFILTYLEIDAEDAPQSFNQKSVFKEIPDKEAMFYINPYDLGSVFTKAQLSKIIKQLDLDNNIEYFKPCNNIDIITRVLKNLYNAYLNSGHVETLYIKQLVEVFE